MTAQSKLNVDEPMTEPAALTATKLYAANGKDIIFLEGILFEFSSTSLSSGSFTKVHTMELGGSNSAFISTASAGVFPQAEPARNRSQLYLVIM